MCKRNRCWQVYLVTFINVGTSTFKKKWPNLSYFLSELNMHSLYFPAIQSRYINIDFSLLEKQFIKSHNKFNKEFFMTISIIKSTAPEQDYSGSFWSVFAFKLWTFYYRIKETIAPTYCTLRMQWTSADKQILAASTHFKRTNCIFERHFKVSTSLQWLTLSYCSSNLSTCLGSDLKLLLPFQKESS